MAKSRTSIAIIGAGIGGLAAAAALRRVGIDVVLYEQAQRFGHVGAGIQITANGMTALRGLGLETLLRRGAFAPDVAYNREGDSGTVTNMLPMGPALAERYGAPDLAMHRSRLHDALAGLVPAEVIRFGKTLVGLDRAGAGFALSFADGTKAAADAVIGADGIHSKIREILFGAEAPRFTGRVAYRTTFPTALLGGAAVDGRCKWWGADRHVVNYFTTASGDEIYFIAVAPEPDFAVESWSMKGDPEMLDAAFAGFHPQVRAMLSASPEIRKWALVERDPMPSWGAEGVVLLGDACHPMTPFMAQGATSSIEDAVVLSRCLDGIAPDGVAAAFRRYEANRKARTARMQLTNRQNTWLRFKTDTDWVYAYDAWTVPLVDADAAPQDLERKAI